MRGPRLVLAAIALAAAAPIAAAQPPTLEFPVKAAFLYKFGAYVEWPASAFPSPASPFTVCVVGHDPFGALLDRSVQGQTVGARPIVVRRVGVATGAAGCHIAFVGGSSEHPAAAALKALAGAPVLTVTDGPVNEGRGAIHFIVTANRVRFIIDLRAAAAGGLTVSSKLLNLAAEVDR
ncbi:YfiR family protein [Phenylobacterium sp.]|jgi:hypothetical protein|uniref:YfiR family protein n=1 Tax=Phenylobacterium sp. TaxID=1871053 RepID=UPI002F3E779A